MAKNDIEPPQDEKPSRPEGPGREEKLFADKDIREELEALARRLLRGEQRSPTFSVNDLLQEAYFRVLKSSREHVENLGSLKALATRAMREALFDRAKKKKARKRAVPPDKFIDIESPGLDAKRFDLTSRNWEVQMLHINDLLTLVGRKVSPHAEQILELRFFHGLSNEKIADELTMDVRTIQRYIKSAHEWLVKNL